MDRGEVSMTEKDFGIAVNEDGNIHIMVDDVLTPLEVYQLIRVMHQCLFQSARKTGRSIDEDFLR